MEPLHASALRPRRRRIASVVREGRQADSSRGEIQADDGLGLRLTPAQVDEAWQRLLEETLPPEKREALNESYEEECDPERRYHMLLEFSSYLRQSNDHYGGQHGRQDGDDYGDQSAYGHAEPMNQPFPAGATQFVKRGGLSVDDPSLIWEVSRVLLLVALIVAVVLGVAYYVGQQMGDLVPQDNNPSVSPHGASLDDDGT